MRSRTFRTVLLVLAVVVAAPLAAETMLTMEFLAPHLVGGETPTPTRYTVWVDRNRVREDRDSRSVIVDKTAGKMYVLRHGEKTYYEFDLPLDFESLVPEDLHEQYRAVLDSRKTEVTILPTTAKETIGTYETTRYEALLRAAGGTEVKMLIWTAPQGFGFDPENYKELMLEIAAMQPGADEWIRKLFTIPGFPVRTERHFTAVEGEGVSTETLVGVETKDAPDGIWRPSSDYTRTPFDLGSAPLD